MLPAASEGSVVEVPLRVPRDGTVIPASLWLPPARTVGPVVLLGHGGSGHKSSERVARLAQWFAEAAGLASLAIDGPFHGERTVPGDGPTDYQQRIAERGAEATHNHMTKDWLAALRTVGDSGLVDSRCVAFLGMSMGARFGLPLCAALESRLACAVIGKFGIEQSKALPAGVSAPALVEAAARRLSAPVLQHMQWHDEVFPRAGQLALFDLFPSPDEQLRARAGGHGQTRPDDEQAWCQWVKTHTVLRQSPPG